MCRCSAQKLLCTEAALRHTGLPAAAGRRRCQPLAMAAEWIDRELRALLQTDDVTIIRGCAFTLWHPVLRCGLVSAMHVWLLPLHHKQQL